MKEKFQKLADKLLNDKFLDFKEEFIFYEETGNNIYDPDLGDYVKDVIENEVSGTPIKISKDLLSSGIYERGDIEVIFIFSELPFFTDLGVKVLRSSSGIEYTIIDYKPDTAKATVRIQLRR